MEEVTGYEQRKAAVAGGQGWDARLLADDLKFYLRFGEVRAAAHFQAFIEHWQHQPGYSLIVVLEDPNHGQRREEARVLVNLALQSNIPILIGGTPEPDMILHPGRYVIKPLAEITRLDILQRNVSDLVPLRPQLDHQYTFPTANAG